MGRKGERKREKGTAGSCGGERSGEKLKYLLTPGGGAGGTSPIFLVTVLKCSYWRLAFGQPCYHFSLSTII